MAAAGNLLTADCDLVNACDVFGSTPLHLAAMADNVDMTNFLIGKHAGTIRIPVLITRYVKFVHTPQ